MAHGKHTHVKDSYQLTPERYVQGRNILTGLALIGWAGLAAGFSMDPARFHQSYLAGFLLTFSIVIGSLFFVMVQHLTGAAWSVTVRRIAENIAAAMPVCAVLFIPVALGAAYTYSWSTHPVHGKEAYLSNEWFYIRAAIFFAIWSVLALKLNANSTAQDETKDLKYTRSSGKFSPPGMLFLFLTGTLASFDWIMSLDPHWYSTIFGIYFLSGSVYGFYAVIILIALTLRKQGILENTINAEHYHDLGKWMFAHTVFWAYIAFSQYMLIWYANLPEETIFFQRRLVGNWKLWSAMLILGHFFLPFFVLMSRASKRNLKLLRITAAWVFFMHWLDLYWLVMPAFQKDGASLHWMDFAAAVATVSLVGLEFWRRMGKRSIVAIGDPEFEKGLEFQNV
jgi:hypothetical protein